ncbi:hypothetical protein OG689_36235 [Kitasatospora sp. NBC_00240]|uniref:hypothetical protein n=1 Tax=Kitasatospora sp. NBC_00240 TaxID=2903567 RepID=UPI0022546909|nr:hypothetical protein [Kitasatospora sp. NBC_00240]MCX5214646.1 hypothetical protein [Kitasatospora sp. NBC_00240]
MSVPVGARAARAPGVRGPALARGAAGVGAVVLGLAGGYGTAFLVAAARSYCDAAWEPQHRFVFSFVEWPGLELLCLVAAVAVWAGSRRLTAGLAIGWRGVVPVSLVLLTLAVLAIGCFAVLGTPSGYPGDSGLCPASNIPPWWPSGLPA